MKMLRITFLSRVKRHQDNQVEEHYDKEKIEHGLDKLHVDHQVCTLELLQVFLIKFPHQLNPIEFL